jgi:helix-turn-helix protein
METMNLTALEKQALQTITYSDFYERGRDSILWDFSVYDICTIAKRSRAGVYSSLVQKGLIEITEKERPYTLNENGEKIRNKYYERGGTNFGTIRITKDGYALLDKLELIDEDGCFI